MRLSFELRTPLVEILRWPSWQIEAYAAFRETEPPAEQRLELLVAWIASRMFNVTRPAGAQARSASSFLLNPDRWTAPGDPSALDEQIGADLDAIGQRFDLDNGTTL